MLDKKLLHILQHSLGLDQYGQGRAYRNHFVAGADDVVKCRELVGGGYMTECQGNQLSGGGPIFMVTTKGRDCVALESPNPPSLSRSQRRYKAWRSSETNESFGEWLKNPYWDNFRKECGV